MMSASVEAEGWRLGRWGFFIAIIFAVQLALIFWLGNASPVRPRPPAAAPAVHLAANYSSELLMLQDPTLFALPHRQGFSGSAWLKMPRMNFRSFDWSEPTNWLSLPILQLGAGFGQFTETNRFDSWQLPASPEPDLRLPEFLPLAIGAGQSRLRLEGGLAKRRLLTPLELTSWEHKDLLTNSVVQMLVDGEGRPQSFVLLLPGSGETKADQQAINLARAARFEPMNARGPGRISNPLTNLTWGQMVFEWHTLPAAPTNTP